MITMQWVVYMVVVCSAIFGVLYSFMAKQLAKQTALYKEKIALFGGL